MLFSSYHEDTFFQGIIKHNFPKALHPVPQLWSPCGALHHLGYSTELPWLVMTFLKKISVEFTDVATPKLQTPQRSFGVCACETALNVSLENDPPSLPSDVHPEF